ncbi:MFS transporter [Undibacterium cyanobacteriorum]|uniref:MFS transporter n=1 Tax=Undibacterium cyanobacteriorum TaxID=3073561 RepID=A0ABY9RFB5_9BURK|nr:MFS transporter [Undibacterium sp. 20NA77.5]WMW79636.1 MFS transporter [Undibacterium sp. 20NA77.5]
MQTTNSQSPPNEAPASNALFQDKNFVWMLIGGITSMLGDQFTMIALPWLVLQLSNDAAQLGLALALLGVPRAVLILIGGAVVDRYSPKRVLMLSKHINTALLLILIFAILSAHIQLWMLHAIALALGISTAFSIPSGSSMLPRVVSKEHLQKANGMMLSLRQVTFFLGPIMAGGLIALIDHNKTSTSTNSTYYGIAAAFAFDCFSYAFSAWTLSRVQVRTLDANANPHKESSKKTGLLTDTIDGLRYCWNDVMLRTCFLYWSAIAFFVMGPLQIAMPLLAQHINNSASTLGLLGGTHGAGTLVGMVFASVFPRLRLGNLGRTLLLVDAIIALLFAPLGWVDSSWPAASLLFVIGLLGGFLHVAVFTWIQSRVAPNMLGRTMSVFMFIFMGIGPISAAITGYVMQHFSLSQLFGASSVLLLVIVIIAIIVTPLKQMEEAKPQQAPAGS